MDNKTIIPCPTCHKTQLWDIQNSYRPFCSERCKLIDLGEWVDESRKIPGNPANLGNNQEPE